MRKYGEGTAKMLGVWLELRPEAMGDPSRECLCPFNNPLTEQADDRTYFVFMRRYCIGVCSARFARVNKQLPERGTGGMGKGKCPCRIYELFIVEREARKFIREIREEK